MPTKLNEPVILISGGSASSASVQAAATMIAGTGAVPMIISNHLGLVKGKDRDGLYAEATRLMQKADGILVMGNFSDIDPGEYGQPKDAKTTSELTQKDGTVNEEGMARRNLETLLIKIALGAGMPMFGICAGMQRMNVICGGTLHQHLPDQIAFTPHSEHEQLALGIPLSVPVQPVTIKKESSLGTIAEQIKTIFTPARTVENDISLDVNSMHHQAVDKIGTGLRVAAHADDVLKDGSRLTEAIEIDPKGALALGPMGNKRFGIFTQWHPEFSDNPLGAKISQTFVAEARAFAKATGHEHTLEEVQEENRLSALAVIKEPGTDTITRPGSMTDRILKQRADSQSFGVTG